MITALEPGAWLDAVLRRNVAGLAVTVEETRFEDYGGSGYDLAYAAEAFHWIDADAQRQQGRPDRVDAQALGRRTRCEPALRPGARRAVPVARTYAIRAYLELIDTYSDHVMLPDDRRVPLYAAIADAIERHGGQIEIPYLAMAFLAQRLR